MGVSEPQALEARVSRSDETPAAARVLVLAPTGRDAAMLQDRIVGAGMSCEICPDLKALLASMSVGAAAAVIAHEALPQGGAERLLGTLDAQEPWSDIHVFFLSEARSNGPVAGPGFFAHANVTLLERPLGIRAFLSSVRSAVRARHRQYQMRDIHLELERALQFNRLSEAKFSGIISVSADAIITMDQEQRITLFNDGAERIFGYSRAEAIGAPLDLLVPEQLRAIHRQRVERFARGSESARRMGERGAEVVGLRKNGDQFPADAAISRLEVDGTRILIVSLRDITEQKREEKRKETLAEAGVSLASTLEYEKTLTGIADLAVKDFADFCIIDVLEDNCLRRVRVSSRNPSRQDACDTLRRSRSDPGRAPLVWPALQEKKAILFDEVTPELMASWAQSDEELRSLQELQATSVLVAPLFEFGKVSGVITFISAASSPAYGQEDLRFSEEFTNLASLEINNARLYRVAEQAIQAREQMLAVVAHDLRTPLSNISLMAALLRRCGKEPERRSARPAEAIERAVARMDRIIQDLLDVARLEAGQLSVEQSRVPAGRVVSDSVEAQELLASSASIELRLDVAPDVHQVWGDLDRLLQVFDNLIGNAIKFTPPDGRILVGAAPREGEILFWVADTGPGIAARDLPHLFERFWQQRKADRHGAGLGLFIVKGIVEAHGGRIWAESTVGRGSTFFFTIPTASGS